MRYTLSLCPSLLFYGGSESILELIFMYRKILRSEGNRNFHATIYLFKTEDNGYVASEISMNLKKKKKGRKEVMTQNSYRCVKTVYKIY